MIAALSLKRQVPWQVDSAELEAHDRSHTRYTREVQGVEQSQTGYKLQKFEMFDYFRELKLSSYYHYSQQSWIKERVHDETRGEHTYEGCQKRLIATQEIDYEPYFETDHERGSDDVEDSDEQQPTLQIHYYYYNQSKVNIVVTGQTCQKISLDFLSYHISRLILLSKFIYKIFAMQESAYSYPLQEKQLWLKHLQDHGYVVLKQVLKEQEVARTLDMFWEWLEALGSGIKRDDPETWVDSNWPGSGSIGFFASYGGCHTKANWFIRTHPRVKQAFATIWNTEKLITSFDTCICWRPWWNQVSKNAWNPHVQNLHCDQNPNSKKGFHCVQGMLPLIDVRADGVGGLQVVPDTNNDKTQKILIQRYPWVQNSKSDWLQLKPTDPFIGTGKLLQCKAGDLILFDSRTIHGGKILEPSQQYKQSHMNKLVRMAQTVAMVPRDMQSAMNRERRMNAFKQRIGLTHWPQEYIKSAFGVMAVNIDRDKIKYEWPELTPEIQEMI